MTWLPYGILVVGLASVIFEYRLKYIDKDGRTIDHKRKVTSATEGCNLAVHVLGIHFDMHA